MQAKGADGEPDGPLAGGRISRKHRRIADHLELVGIEDAGGRGQTLRTTDEHPFFVPEKGWTKSRLLQAGDALAGPAGVCSIVTANARQSHPEGVVVYNMEVEAGRGTSHVLDVSATLVTLLLMPRRPRIAPGGMVYHVLNRGNCRMEVFSKEGDYLAFLKLLEEGRRRTGMRILGYCLMPNHWHLVLWPRKDGDLARFVGWVSTTHVRRWRAHRGSDGEGHLYQGRYKSFIVARDGHLLTVLRYVEQNALRAKLVQRAEDWPWGSAAGADGPGPEPDTWPVDRPRAWAQRLNEDLPAKVLERLRLSGARGRPYGTEGWTSRVVNRLGLGHTVRDPWRPKREGREKGKEAN